MRCAACFALVTLILCSAPTEQSWAGGLLFREPGSTCPAQLPADYADALLARIAQLDQTVFPLGSMSARLHEERLALLLFAHEQGNLLWRQGEPDFSLYSAVLSNHVRDKLDGFKLAFIRALQVGAEQEARATLMLAMAFTVEFLDVLEVLGVFFFVQHLRGQHGDIAFSQHEMPADTHPYRPVQSLGLSNVGFARHSPGRGSGSQTFNTGHGESAECFCRCPREGFGCVSGLSPYSRQPEAEERRQPRTCPRQSLVRKSPSPVSATGHAGYKPGAFSSGE